MTQHPGYEVWAVGGPLRSVLGNVVATDGVPYPNFRIWWDGDLMSENLNETKIDKFGVGRLFTGYRVGATETARSATPFYGDIFGDWREEVIFEHWMRNELLIFTTTTPSSERIYTLAHNPAY
jgi:rhamnogalacturonan endolyase